jgi:hypothetical protein
MAVSASRSVVRRWGPGTGAIVRLLIASRAPLTQVAIATAVGVTQPRASQVLKQLAQAGAVRATPEGYVGRPDRLLDLYAGRARPLLLEPETHWYSTHDPREQARRISDAARRAHASVSFSADLGPDLLVPWRHPTLTVFYTPDALDPLAAGMAPAEGRGDATIAVRRTAFSAPTAPRPAVAGNQGRRGHRRQRASPRRQVVPRPRSISACRMLFASVWVDAASVAAGPSDRGTVTVGSFPKPILALGCVYTP